MNSLKRYGVLVAVLTTLVSLSVIEVWFFVWFFTTYFNSWFLHVLATHLCLVALAFTGTYLSKLGLRGVGITSSHVLWSVRWGLYLSVSTCLPTLATAYLLGLMGCYTLRAWGLSPYLLITLLPYWVLLVSLSEELFFRGYVQGVLGRIIGSSYAALLSGLIFGIVHIDNYLNPLLGLYRLDLGVLVWVILSCFEGIFLSLLRSKCGDIYCSTIFHGLQDYALSIMTSLGCSRVVEVMAMSTGWAVMLGLTFRKFLRSQPPNRLLKESPSRINELVINY